ncbi:MAG: sulfurtransferase TusA family protein, partial [Oscillospiraceae bacterium]
MAGFTAENLLSGLLSLSPWDVVEHCDPADTILLDVREKAERLAFSAPGTVGIPLGELRDRLSELDSQKRVVVFCAIGVRAYNAARILVQHGFRRVGGSRFYRSTHYRAYATPATSKTRSSSDGSHEEDHHHPASSASACMRLDCSGLQCPGPLMKVFEAMKSLPNDGIMEVSASDPGFASDIGAWCRRTGNALLGSEKRDN